MRVYTVCFRRIRRRAGSGDRRVARRLFRSIRLIDIDLTLTRDALASVTSDSDDPPEWFLPPL